MNKIYTQKYMPFFNLLFTLQRKLEHKFFVSDNSKSAESSQKFGFESNRIIA